VHGCSLFQGIIPEQRKTIPGGMMSEAKPHCKKVKHQHLAGLNTKLQSHGLASLLDHFD